MPTLSQIETAICARLRAQIPYLRACASLADFLARDLEDLETIALQLPAAYVAYEGGEYEHLVSGVQDRTMLFAVLAVVANYRGEESVRHGMGAEKGAYDLLEDIRAALSDQDCGIAMDPLLPIREGAIDGNDALQIYGITFRTRCRATL